MSFLDNQKYLFTVAFVFFLILTIFVAILPALDNQARNAPLPNAEPLSEAEQRGKALYIANGCVACHTQQVRNLDMDKVWGRRPSIAADYALNDRPDPWRNTATLMGSERTGPDLTDIGNRQPNLAWNLVHLYNPRIVVSESIMPAYPWLFEVKYVLSENDVAVTVPEEFRRGEFGFVVAKQEALDLVAYLQSLKQVDLPSTLPAPDFLYKRTTKTDAAAAGSTDELDGAALYAQHCQACHQANGAGLAGAFPSLVGSSIVNDDDKLELYIDIIMNGYDSRPEYASMTPVGSMAEFTEKEVAAIINHERTSWGNHGKKVTPEEIKSMVDYVKLHSPL